MAPFWRVWGGSWAPLGRSWAMLAFLGRSWSLLGRLFGLMGALDLISGGVWEALGRFLGKILKEFWEDFWRISSFQRSPRCLANSLGVTIRGGPSPSVVRPGLLGSLGPKALQRGVRTSRRGPSNFFILGAKLAPSSHFFAICLHLFRTMLRSCVF